MTPLTADTITDEQIRELLDVLTTERGAALLALKAMNTGKRYAARARCAEILNARAASEATHR